MAPMVWAHRGAPLGTGDLPPENTLAAFHRALETGADGLEFDLQMTRDKHFVVHHDLHLEHPRLGRVAIPDLILEEIREMEADHLEHIPTFSEVIEWSLEHDLPLVPELKTPYECEQRGLDLVGEFCRRVDDFGIAARVVVQCFHAHTLDELRRRRPDLTLLALYRHDQCVEFDRVPGEAEYLGLPMLSVFFLGRDLANPARERGKRLVPWREMSLVENPEVFDRMADLEVHALMVDDAERALSHYGRRPPLPELERWAPQMMCRQEPAQSRRSRRPEESTRS